MTSAIERFIATQISFEHDGSHPDDRHVVVVAELLWDERMKPGRPEATGQWVVHFVDGHDEEIDLPRESRDGAVEEARNIIAGRLAAGGS